jgi:hypothetical protein
MLDDSVRLDDAASVTRLANLDPAFLGDVKTGVHRGHTFTLPDAPEIELMHDGGAEYVDSEDDEQQFLQFVASRRCGAVFVSNAKPHFLHGFHSVLPYMQCGELFSTRDAANLIRGDRRCSTWLTLIRSWR